MDPTTNPVSSVNQTVTAAPKHKNHHFLLLFFIILTIISLSVTFYLLVKKPDSSEYFASNVLQRALISGTFDINGVIPAGATITLDREDVLSHQDAHVSQTFPAVDQGTWSFGDVTTGKTYIVTAHVTANGKTIATSDPIEVSAPAAEEVLVLNIPAANPSGTAIISGNIRVDGYIPPGATITIQGKKLGEKKYTPIASNLTGAPSQFMSYASAVAGQTYEVVGMLLDQSGNQIGISAPLDIDAPATNEQLTINSKAVPPATITPTPATSTAATTQPTPVPTPAMISGSIDFNGVAPANSRIVILEKIYNSQQYQVAVNNVTPLDNTTWQWTGPQAGTWYNIIAVLKQAQPNGTDQDVATSQMQSIAAPATNVVFTINSGLNLSPPNGQITASCGNLSGSTWGGQMQYQSVPGAQSYWLEVGSAQGSNDIYNAIQNTNNQSNQTASVNFQNGITYYARYAYATSPNAGQPQFSPFSSSIQFKCSQ